jgi:bis(5'-nucleosyl)-tetraphosphatase (symmetrical)
MATWVIGDVQGCFDSLRALVQKISFKPSRDRLWFVGDLVNRGPKSLDVLRWLMDNADRVTCVFGNHDLHFLARAHGLAPPKNLDTLDSLLRTKDLDDIVRWLCTSSFAHSEDEWIMVHAGFSPLWTVGEGLSVAASLNAEMRDPVLRRGLLMTRRENPSVRMFTVTRTLHEDGTLCDFSGKPEDAPRGCQPWFRLTHRREPQIKIVFGHWSALGLHQERGAFCLDTGCVWGKTLTAMRLEDQSFVSQPALEKSTKTLIE